MNEIVILLLGFLQGVTEFLPISSSAHLIIFPLVFDEQPYGLFIDAVLHLATMFAVSIYFIKDVTTCFRNKRLFKIVLIATIPIFIFGAYVSSNNSIGDFIQTPLVIALATIIFALLLLFAEKKHDNKTHDLTHYDLTLKQSLSIGLFQALSIIPGVSRMGACLTAGYFVGLTKKDSLRFTFLLSIPTILGAFSFELFTLASNPEPTPSIFLIISSFLIAFFTATLVIHFLFKTIERITLLPFVVYRIAFGIFIIFALVI